MDLREPAVSNGGKSGKVAIHGDDLACVLGRNSSDHCIGYEVP